MLSLLVFTLNIEAKNIKKDFNFIINESNISPNSVAISVKNLETGKVVYQKNEKILIHPASMQKILTIVPIVETLGEDYNFKTQLYSRGKDGYLIKLGADPYLTSDNLGSLIKKINAEKIKQVYIDSSVIEPKDWGEGWQWDDDLNSYMPRFNSYNLDGNLVKITIMPTEMNKSAFVINPQKSQMVFLNNVITGSNNNINISRDNIISANTIKLDGEVNTPETLFIPNNNLKLYFYKKLRDELEDNKIYLKTSYINTKQTKNDKFETELSHSISQAIDDVLLNSNNMVIETMGKLAGGKYYNKQGTDVDAVKLFNEFYQKQGLDSSRIRLVDSSGVSKNNLVDADFVSEFLVKNKENKVLEKMSIPSTGTLAYRMIPLKDNLKAKTGTLSDISTIAGFLTSKSGNKYAFCIMINDPKSTSSEKKVLEDYIIRDMYLKL